MGEEVEKEGMIIIPEDTEDDDEYVPWGDILEGVRETLAYAQGKKPAFVTKYVDGKRVSAQWQMADGTRVEAPEEQRDPDASK